MVLIEHWRYTARAEAEAAEAVSDSGFVLFVSRELGIDPRGEVIHERSTAMWSVITF